MKLQIGNFVLSEPRVYKREYETASWYRMIQVPAGTYPIMGTFREYWLNNEPRKVEDLCVSMDGIVVSSYFENRLLHAVSAKKDEDVGQKDKVYLSPYAFAVARLVADGKAEEWQLFDECDLRYTEYWDEYYKTNKRLYSIHWKGEM